MIVESIKSEYQRYKALAEAALAQIKDDDLHKVLGEDGNSIVVGQIVLMARTHVGRAWKSLSIPRGKSQEYNLNPT